MFACGQNNYENLSEFCNNSVMCSENNNFCASALNQQYNIKEFPNAITTQCLNSSTGIRQYQQHNILEESSVITNNPKCIVQYNTDQQNFLYGEFYNNIPVNEIKTDNSSQGNIYHHIPLSYTRKTPLKCTLKRKRQRTIFTTEQIIALEEVFKKKPYVHREERIELMHKLHISERSIKVWFQNRRRLSDKKCQDYNLDSPLSESSSDTISDRITWIESYVNQNSDENGFVTLDDEMMGTLVDIVDKCLPRDISFDKTPVESVNSDPKTIYEPISPVSLCENSENQDESVTFENQELLLGITDYYYL